MWHKAWRRKSPLFKFTLIGCATVIAVGTLYLALSPDPYSPRRTTAVSTMACSGNEHKLALVIPFRDRFEELLEFVPHMRDFLDRQGVCFKIFVVNQGDSLRFNRGALVNVGFLLGANASCDYLAMHDVDLLPLNDNLSYSYPARGPRHLAAPGLHPKYNYRKFVGGILLITNEHFKRVNGMSNRFWGWGREDDEFYRRLNESGLPIFRPKGITTDNATTFKHNHENTRRQRDNFRYGYQTKMTKNRASGVANVDYSILSRHDVIVDGDAFESVNVRLNCDIRDTPWCMTPRQLASAMASLRETLSAREFEEIDVRVKRLMPYEDFL